MKPEEMQMAIYQGRLQTVATKGHTRSSGEARRVYDYFVITGGLAAPQNKVHALESALATHKPVIMTFPNTVGHEKVEIIKLCQTVPGANPVVGLQLPVDEGE